MRLGLVRGDAGGGVRLLCGISPVSGNVGIAPGVEVRQVGECASRASNAPSAGRATGRRRRSSGSTIRGGGDRGAVRIKPVLSPVPDPGPFDPAHVLRRRDLETPQRKDRGPDRDARLRGGSPPPAFRARHHGRTDLTLGSYRPQHRVETITEPDHFGHRHPRMPLPPQGVDHLREPCPLGITRRHRLRSSRPSTFCAATGSPHR